MMTSYIGRATNNDRTTPGHCNQLLQGTHHKKPQNELFTLLPQ